MQLGEAVAVAIADDRHDPDCYFCNAKDEPKEEENDLDADPEEDDDLDGGYVPDGMKFKNDASKLGKALGGTPNPKEISLAQASGQKKGKSAYDVSVAAHHLIPGNAALKNSDLYKSKEYLWTDGKKKGNIGYSINSAPNGVWLPGNYALRPWSGRAPTFQSNYAFAAIEEWRAQFHDAHTDYSKFVIDVLDKICEKLDDGREVWCPKAKKREDKPEDREPLYVIVNRLHTVSARMHRMLVFPLKSWKKNIYTSRFSLLYMEDQ
jgi:hypothetical protein